MAKRLKKLTVDKWIEEAQIVEKKTSKVYDDSTSKNSSFTDDCLFDDFNQAKRIARKHPELQIWTLVDGEGSSCYVIEGWHFVNRLGYFFGKKKISDSELMSALMKRDGGISIKY